MSEMVAVVGSGPIGSYAALKMLRAGYAVTMFDIGHTIDTKIAASDIPPWGLKPIFGSYFPYDLNKFVRQEETGFRTFPSKGHLGFSTVWGATWDLSRNSNDPEFNSVLSEITEDIRKSPVEMESIGRETYIFNQQNLCDCLKVNFAKIGTADRNSKIRVVQTDLLISQKRCAGTGNCQMGCSTKAIWSSEEIFNACKQYSKFEYIPGYFVNKIRQQDKDWFLENELALKMSGFTKIFLCGGPIGNIGILSRSGLATQVEFQETRMRYLFFINLKATKRHKSDFALSLFSMDLRDSQNKERHIQFYAHLYRSLARLIPHKRVLWLQKLISLLLKTIRHRLIVGLEYLDTEYSGKLSASMNENGLLSISIGKANLKPHWLREYFRIILKTGLIPIFLVKKQPGESYHLGASNLQLTEHKEMLNAPGCYVLGTLSIIRIHPGPATSYALYDIAKHWKKWII